MIGRRVCPATVTPLSSVEQAWLHCNTDYLTLLGTWFRGSRFKQTPNRGTAEPANAYGSIQIWYDIYVISRLLGALPPLIFRVDLFGAGSGFYAGTDAGQVLLGQHLRIGQL